MSAQLDMFHWEEFAHLAQVIVIFAPMNLSAQRVPVDIP